MAATIARERPSPTCWTQTSAASSSRRHRSASIRTRATAHYSAAKAALIGLMRCLALEGREHNVLSNAVAPYSATRMTAFTEEEQASSPIGPRYLAQLAVWLSHQQTSENGSLFEVGGGYIHKLRWELSDALHLPDDEHTAENIAAGAGTFDQFSGLHPDLGDFHTIGRAVFGDDLDSAFSRD